MQWSTDSIQTFLFLSYSLPLYFPWRILFQFQIQKCPNHNIFTVWVKLSLYFNSQFKNTSFFSGASWHWPFSSHNHYYHQWEDLECCSSSGTSHHPKKYNIQFSSSSYHHPSQYKHIFMKSEMLFASHATRPLSSWLTFGTTHYIASPLHSLTSFK